MTSQGKQQTSGIVTPHEHDVLSGRGNFVNYHAGNEHFRALVRKHKLEYVRCPKPQKGKFSRMIVEEIRNRNPPGRFLKQDGATKLWYDIGEKKALDKTRQALREGAPEIMKELTGDEEGSDGEVGDSTFGGVHKDAFHSMGGAMGIGAGYDGSNPYATGMGTILPPPAESPVLNVRSHHGTPHTPPMSHVTGQTDPSLTMAQGMMMPNSQIPSEVSNQMPQLSSHRQMQQLSDNNVSRQVDQILPLEQHLHQSIDPSLTRTAADQLNGQIMNTGLGAGARMGNDAINSHAGTGGQDVQDVQGFGDEMQALQNKLASIYPVGQFEPRPIDPKLAGRLTNNPKESSPEQPDKATSGGQNSRRMPPPSLKRDDSLKISNIFNDGNSIGSSSKKKIDGNGSSAHLSTMSLSIGELDQDNLSSVFDNSLRVSNHTNPRDSKTKRKDDAQLTLDMSVATINDKFSENGNMSFATFGDGKMHESEGNMSFSQVFDDH